MLAGETAAGAYPAQRGADARRDHPRRRVEPRVRHAVGDRSTAHDDHAQALCEAAVTLADRGDAQAIVAVTRGGDTARRLSALRPRAPIVAATEREDTARRLALYWGVVPLCMPIGDNLDEASARIGAAARRPRPCRRRRRRRPRQHQPGPDAERRQLPQDSATLMPASTTPTIGAVRARVRAGGRARQSVAQRAHPPLLGGLDIVGADNRAAVHGRAQSADSGADAARLRRRRPRERLARARALRPRRAARGTRGSSSTGS